MCDRSMDCAGSVRFCNSLMMSVSQCRNLGCGDDFVTCTLEFISRLRTTSIDSTEFCLLCAIVLTYPGLSVTAVCVVHIFITLISDVEQNTLSFGSIF